MKKKSLVNLPQVQSQWVTFLIIMWNQNVYYSFIINFSFNRNHIPPSTLSFKVVIFWQKWCINSTFVVVSFFWFTMLDRHILTLMTAQIFCSVSLMISCHASQRNRFSFQMITYNNKRSLVQQHSSLAFTYHAMW